jgi:hypothetical protein
MTHPKMSRALTIVAVTSFAGWLSVFVVYLAWSFWPVNLPTVEQPIPILNQNRTVAVGEPIVMQLRVNKPQPVNVRSANRVIRCDSGNLITLTPTAVDLPTGEFVVESSSVILPGNIIHGDRCTFLYRIGYYINPVRTETAEYESEPFITVTDYGSADHG